MRDVLLKVLVLCFALSSVACACPGFDQAGATNAVHAGHAMHGAAQHDAPGSHGAEPPGDCCDDCDGSTERLVQDTRPADKDTQQDTATRPFAWTWEAGYAEPPKRIPPDIASRPADSTPVSLRDRMLD
jgi:hypothetical protein